MNNKGFTLVELITTFALASAIILILINIVSIIKDLSSDSNIKTKLITNQSALSNELNKKINNDNLLSYNACSKAPFCYEFNLSNGEVIDLIITDSTIRFGKYVYKIEDGVTVSNPEVKTEYVSIADPNVKNSFLIIKIPIKHKLYPNEDYGINLVYPYNSNITGL